VRVIRAFVRDDAEERRFDTATADQTDTAIAAGRLSALLNPATLFVMDMGVVAILWAGGNQVMVGELTQGQVMAFVNYMTQTLLSIVYVANLVVIFTKASASAARVKEVLDTPVSICDGPGAEGSGCKDSPAISIQDVCFRFPDSGKDTLSHVSLEVAPGQTLGIIGGTGSGKSTLMALMQRLYDATSGSVLIRGVDVRDYRLDELRGTLAVVPQAPSLVSGTLRENLVWRDSQATDDELWHALELAQAAEFVRRMPEGLDSPVEASGKNFSGGQRQRLTIARALVGRPSILLLDDPFSALDYATDRSLRDALAADDPSRTTVMISQRVSSVREASLICVLDSGRVIGLGTHDELVDTCPVYKEICLSQLRPEEVGA
jgi:ATP-binding cassette subfamily B protein